MSQGFTSHSVSGLYALLAARIVIVRDVNTQNAATATWTKLTWATEIVDTDNLHSTVSTTSRLTAPIAGKYYVFGVVRFAGNGTGQRFAAITANGGSPSTTEAIEGNIPNVSASFDARVNVSGIISLAAGEYVELWGFQDSGGDLNMNAGVTKTAKFGMAYLGE